jgi:hypothetical protein
VQSRVWSADLKDARKALLIVADKAYAVLSKIEPPSVVVPEPEPDAAMAAEPLFTTDNDFSTATLKRVNG